MENNSVVSVKFMERAYQRARDGLDYLLNDPMQRPRRYSDAENYGQEVASAYDQFLARYDELKCVRQAQGIDLDYAQDRYYPVRSEAFLIVQHVERREPQASALSLMPVDEAACRVG